MRKSRNIVVDYDESIHDKMLDTNSNAVLEIMLKLGVSVPSWSKVSVIKIDYDKVKTTVVFFESVTDFLLWHSKKIITEDEENYKILIFVRNEENNQCWLPLMPPTLIGVGVKTKVRQKNDDITLLGVESPINNEP